MRNPLDLSARTILVTGASSGIGRAIAVLASEMGARVVLVARDESRLEETRSLLAPGEHGVEPFDLAQTAEITRWVGGLVKRHGPLAGLVHAAAVQKTVPLRVVSTKTLEEHWQTNVVAGVMMVKALQARDAVVPGCSVVLLSSTAAVTASPGNSVYSATKGAVSSLARSLAIELLPLGIRVNCIVAALVDTPMVERSKETMSAEMFEGMLAKHPMGMGRAEDIANAAVFLLADTARWITGSSLTVDGGYTAQ